MMREESLSFESVTATKMEVMGLPQMCQQRCEFWRLADCVTTVD